MKNYFKFNIDELVDEYAKLLIIKSNIEERANIRNSNIETQIRKLENKAFALKEESKREIDEIDRTLGKIERQLDNEKIYINSLNVGTKKREAQIPSFVTIDAQNGGKR